MEKNNIRFEEFIVWFSKLEEIPLQTRHDFLEHIIKIGYIDEKSEEFIEITLNDLSKNSKKRQKQWSKYADILKKTKKTQTNEKLSLKKKLATEILDWMNKKSIEFKNHFRTIQSKIMKSQESAEDLENQAQIARLKAAL